jgi:hypothetical protein
MRGGKRAGAGRKPISIDLVELEKLCALQCTYADLASWFGCSEKTIEMRSREPDVAEAMARGKGKGRISIRRAQLKLLEQGNPAMAIWLGKVYLGQKDVTATELTGAQGKPVQLTLEVIDAILSHSKKR